MTTGGGWVGGGVCKRILDPECPDPVTKPLPPLVSIKNSQSYLHL